MKSVLFFMTLLLSDLAFAKPCEVYGISDSPQRLNCEFPRLSVRLTCRNGVYYLNQSRVLNAYHLEVETGTVPLVFESRDMQLTVTDSLGELQREKVTIEGRCL